MRSEPSIVDTVMTHDPSFKTETLPFWSTTATLSSSDSNLSVLSVASSGSTIVSIIKFSPSSPLQESGDIVRVSTNIGFTATIHDALASPQLAVIIDSPIERQ